MRRLGLALLMILSACGGEEDVVTGGFDETIIDKKVNGGVGMSVVDLNGDGTTEVIAAFTGTRAVHVYARPEALTEPWERIAITGLAAITPIDLQVLDVDGDADLDVVVLTGPPPPALGELFWYENPSDLRGVWKTHPITGPTIAGGDSLSSGDVDGDGDADLVVGTQPIMVADDILGGDIHWYQNEGGTFGGPYPVAPDAVSVTDVVVVDFDADSRPDVVAIGTTGLIFMRNTSTATTVGRFTRYVVSPDIGFDALAIANVDDDADLELLVAQTTPPAPQTTTGTVAIDVFDPPDALGNEWPRRNLVDNVLSNILAVPSGPAITTADFDGDGDTDLAIATATPGDIRVYLNEGASPWGLQEIRSGYVGIRRLAVDDIDNDGRVDLLTNTSAFATRDRIAWWRNVGL